MYFEKGEESIFSLYSIIINDYIKQRKEGKNPVFRAKDIEGLKNTECWDD